MINMLQNYLPFFLGLFHDFFKSHRSYQVQDHHQPHHQEHFRQFQFRRLEWDQERLFVIN